MAVRLLLALLLALGLVLPARGAAASRPGGIGTVDAAQRAHAAEHESPTIEADPAPAGADLRAAERAELTTGAVRLLADAGAVDAEDEAARGGLQHRARLARWCDVVQCRRLAGAQLLRYATPPPARG